MISRLVLALLPLLLLSPRPAVARQDALDAHLRMRLITTERLRATTQATRPSALFDARIASGVFQQNDVGVIIHATPQALRGVESAGGTLRARVGSFATATVPVAALPDLARTLTRMEAGLPLATTQPPAVPPPDLSLGQRRAARASGTELPSLFRLDNVIGVLDGGAAPGAHRVTAAGGAGKATAARGAWIAADAAADVSGIDRLRQLRDGRFTGLTGGGVVVGIYDTGLDLEHADFRLVDGRTRVLYAWDQTGTGASPGAVGPHTFGYGEECDAPAIDAGQCTLRDRHGHGTHVAGVAAGNGQALADRRYAGAAPDADIIVVRGGDGNYTSDRLLDGVAYMMERAAQLGRPIVINLSIGTQSGPHDGTTLFESALESLLGPGRIIVAAAGNNGDNRNETPEFPRQSLHATGDAGAGIVDHELIIPPYSPNPGAANDGAILEIWYPGGAELAVTIVTPDGERIRAAPGDTTVAETAAGAVLIDNAFGGPYPGNGDKVALVGVLDFDEAAPPAAGTWRVEIERVGGPASVRHHMWLVGSTFAGGAQLTTLASGTTNTHLVSNPATATGLIAVAAYTSRLQWPGPDGETSSFPFAEAIGDLAQFSSPGPRRDGELKPDVTAPGKLLLAPRSRDATLWAPLPWMLDETGHYAALLGTSMASPYVAGVVALLLERDPTLTAGAAKALLAGSARADAFTARGYQNADAPPPNIHWGAGKLDALAAVRLAGHPAGGVVADVTPVAGAGTVIARAGATIDLLRFALAADTIEPVEVERLDLRLAGRDPAATIELVVDGGSDDGLVVQSRALNIDGDTDAAFAPGPVLAPGETRSFRLRLVLSGAVRHGVAFSARYRAEHTVVRGVFSGERLEPLGTTADVVSETRQASILADGRRWSISENPLRSGRLFIVLDEPPRRAAIYTLAGALVRDLSAEAADAPATLEWRADNGRGTAVASGVYLLLLDFPGERVIQRIMVLRGH